MWLIRLKCEILQGASFSLSATGLVNLAFYVKPIDSLLCLSRKMATDRMEELLGTLNELKGEMSAMKRALEVDREAAEQTLVKKLKLDPPPTFKKKSHEKQFLFKSTVEDKLDACDFALQETPPAIEKAKSALEEGKLLIKKRQKLIKIADRSEYGWATVDEYVEDELAEGEEDERHFFRAEGRAKRRHRANEDKIGNSLLGMDLSLSLSLLCCHVFSMGLVRVPVNPYCLVLACLPVVSALVFRVAKWGI